LIKQNTDQQQAFDELSVTVDNLKQANVDGEWIDNTEMMLGCVGLTMSK
jgi:hypothetical protein